MICIHHFNEAHQQYQDGRIPYRLLQDQAAVMIGLCSNPHPGVSYAWEITESNIQWLLQQEEAMADYSDFLGGYVYVCESEADLRQINGCDFDWAENHGGQWPNVTDKPISVLNGCRSKLSRNPASRIPMFPEVSQREPMCRYLALSLTPVLTQPLAALTISYL